MSPRPPAIPLADARRISLAAQGFRDRAPTGAVDRRHLRRVMGRLHLLQLDSVPVVIRTQYLPLFSRLGPYRTDLLDEIAYASDEWYETWAHEASLVRVDLEPLLRWTKARAAAGATWGGLVRLAREEPGYVEMVYQEVAERGPLAPSQLADPKPRKGAWWDSRSLGSLALDWLFRIGRVGIRRTGNFEKRFDIIERIVPDAVRAQPTPSEADAQRDLAAHAARALGVATAHDVADYFRLGIRDIRPRLAELVEDGRLVEVEVEGWRDRAFLDPAARTPRRIDGETLLSPFDPIVWHRDRTQRLFDFNYRLEIYTPAPKRVYGYYVLPFLLGDRLVARVDLKTDRAARVLRALAVHTEPGIDRGAISGPLHRSLERLASLVGVDAIDYPER